MDRCFEKISFEQFKKDMDNNKIVYDEYELPYRSSISSCGYDFIATCNYVIKPGEIIKIPTGYKFKCNEDEFLMIVVRSSMGFKYNIRMCNQVGIIDSDYYNNIDNEGHMWIKLQNEGDKDYVVKKGDAICQGVFTKYLVVDDEVEMKAIRKGGLGSTNK